MVCANTKCGCGLFDIPGGSIWLLQLEQSCDRPTTDDEGAFSLPNPPQKYFWLCPDCSRRFVIWRWTATGVVLAERRPGARYRNEQGDAADPLPFGVYASTQVEEEFLDVG